LEQPLNHTIPCPVSDSDDRDRPALFDHNGLISYSDLDKVIDIVGGNLKRFDIGPGDIVAVLDDNSLSYAVLFFAAMRYRFTLMPLNTRLTEIDWQSQIDNAGCRLVAVGSDYRGAVSHIKVEKVDFRELLTGADIVVDNSRKRFVNLDRDALVIHTSGSSAKPRGVVLTWGNLYYSALGAASVLDYRPGDNWLAVLPFFHVGGISILFRAILGGNGVHILPRFDPESIMALADDDKIQYLSLVPTMLHELLLADEKNRLSRLKSIVVGGAAWGESLKKEAVRRQLPVLTTYGMTETASMVTLLSPDAPADKLTTSGRVLPYRELKIVDSDGKKVEKKISGRIVVRGEVLFSRYLNGHQRQFDSEGWFVTGDIGFMDRQGFLTVTGRSDRIIVSGGENIDLDLIEKEIEKIDGLAGVAVVARRDKKWGQRPVAAVALSDRSLTAKRILELLGKTLPSIMLPDRIIIVDKIPLTPAGKYDRQELIRLFSGGE